MNYLKIASENLDVVVQELCDWIKINSVYDELSVKENKPFGNGVFCALEYIADLAEKYGFNVSNLYIAQVKKEFDIIERVNYNKGTGGHKVPQVTEKKRDAIIDALKHFKMI